MTKYDIVLKTTTQQHNNNIKKEMNYNCLGNIFRTNNVQEVTEKIWELIDYDTKNMKKTSFLAFTFHFCLLARIFLKAIYININRLFIISVTTH